MDAIFQAALARVRNNIKSFDTVLFGRGSTEVAPEIRVSMRQRRDYWWHLKTKIERRMERDK